MNRTKIEWTDYTWNPITGCTKGCSYCYAMAISKRFKRSFEPTLHPTRLYDVFPKKPSRIFTCSMGDFFDSNVKREWQEQVLGMIEVRPQHTIQILTKAPENIPYDIKFPKNLYLGVTIESDYEKHRANELLKHTSQIQKMFISFEPLLGEVWEDDSNITLFDWFIIGGQTGKKNKKPEKQWIDNLVEIARYFKIPVFIKDNCGYPEKIQEFPDVKLREE